jgi:hypothetical protein
MRTVARTLQLLLLALPALASCAWAAELSGTIHSPTGKLPADVKVVGARRDKLPDIAGSVQGGRYHIVLPDGVDVRLQLEAKGWEAPPKYIWGAITGGALDMLLYPVPVPEPQLAEELIRMGELDQTIRKQMPGLSDQEFWKRMQAEDQVREARLLRIIEEKGWPRISQVGHQAANSAWLIAQHGSPDFLKRCLPLMQAAAGKHEMPLSSLALSIDRVLMNEGKKQVYGSQLQVIDGRTVDYPIDDMAGVDGRRAAMGLEPYAQYRKRFDE